MALTNANLRSEAYTQIKAFLDSISGLDPRNRYKANYIHASMPNINSKGFDGYPFIVLKINIAEDDPSHDPRITDKTFRVQLVVYSLDAVELDTIVDKIRNDLDDYSKLTDFSMRSFSLSAIDYDMDANGKKVVFVTIGMILKGRI